MESALQTSSSTLKSVGAVFSGAPHVADVDYVTHRLLDAHGVFVPKKKATTEVYSNFTHCQWLTNSLPPRPEAFKEPTQ